MIVLAPEQLEETRIPFRALTEADNEKCFLKVVETKETKKVKVTAGLAEWHRCVEEFQQLIDLPRSVKGLLNHDVVPMKYNYVIFDCVTDWLIWKRNGIVFPQIIF